MDDIPELIRHRDVHLRTPVLIAAFRGWNDAGDAASFAAQHLVRTWSAERVASIDPEDFYDFQAVRPHVELVDGLTRRISWPANDVYAARLSGPRDALILIGTEPNLHWRRFCSIVTSFAEASDAALAITLGALLADVPHSIATPVTGTAGDEQLIAELELERSRYEGPTGIVGVLQDALASHGVRSVSLWAAVPHYLAVSPDPKAALALVRRTAAVVGEPVDTSDLQRAAEAYEARVSDIVAQDEDVAAYVRMLEERAAARSETGPLGGGPIPSGEALAAELERFLRERSEGDGA